MSDPPDHDPEDREQSLAEFITQLKEAVEANWELDADPVSELRNPQIEGRQTISFEPTPMQLKAAAQRHRQQTATEDRAHQRTQEAKDKDQRRSLEKWSFIFAGLLILATMIFGASLLAFVDEDLKQQAGLSIIALVLGGISGGIGGYIAGKGAK